MNWFDVDMANTAGQTLLLLMLRLLLLLLTTTQRFEGTTALSRRRALLAILDRLLRIFCQIGQELWYHATTAPAALQQR